MLALLLLVLAFPLGYLIAWLARDELGIGKRFFIILLAGSALLGIFSLITQAHATAWTSGFIAVVSGVSIWKSTDAQFTRKT